MPVAQTNIVYLPLIRRAGLVRLFARLVRAMPQDPPRVLSDDVPAYLRRDVGLPPPMTGREAVGPPVHGRIGIM